MMTVVTTMRPLLWVLGVALLSLVGCVAPPGGTRGQGMVDDSQHLSSTPTTTSSSSSTGTRTDLVTASDETELQRRARIRLELTTTYFADDNTTTALDEVKQALQSDPNRPAAYNLRGLIYARLEEPTLAEDSFRRALQLAPADGDTRHNYGWFLCARQRYPEAFAQFRAATETPQYRGTSKTLLAQGVCEARSGDWGAAERSLQRSYELDAGNPSTAVNLSEVLLRRGELERARFYVGRVNANAEYANAETLWLAARIEQRRGNDEGVRQLGEQLKAKYPGSVQALAYERRRFDD